MINYNKLYSGLFSINLVYAIMTIFEIVFFYFVVCPVVTNNIRNLLDTYKNQNKNQSLNSNQTGILNNIDFDPITIANALNQREYDLINRLNLNSYLIIIIVILLLISLLFYLYDKIGIIENMGNTESASDFNSEFARNRSRSRSESGNEPLHTGMGGIELTPYNLESNVLGLRTSQNSNITRSSSIKMIYLKHAIKCAISTIVCLIFFQIFFYNYGLLFKYVGSTNELIVLFVESIQ